MDYTKLFYWLTVADNAKDMFIAFIVIFTSISTFSTVGYFIQGAEATSDSNGTSDKEAAAKSQAVARKWIWYSYPFMMLFWSLYILTPNKRDALLIVAGGQTMNFLANDSSAKQIPHELSSFVVTELKNMATEAQVDLNLNNQKEKILKQAKSMSAKEILEKAEIDSTFAKVILGK